MSLPDHSGEGNVSEELYPLSADGREGQYYSILYK